MLKISKLKGFVLLSSQKHSISSLLKCPQIISIMPRDIKLFSAVLFGATIPYPILYHIPLVITPAWEIFDQDQVRVFRTK